MSKAIPIVFAVLTAPLLLYGARLGFGQTGGPPTQAISRPGVGALNPQLSNSVQSPGLLQRELKIAAGDLTRALAEIERLDRERETLKRQRDVAQDLAEALLRELLERPSILVERIPEVDVGEPDDAGPRSDE